MSIYGDESESDKFYIIDSTGSIQWVPSLRLAKLYVSDPNIKEWYKKDIYCTNESIEIGYDGKKYLKSQLPDEPDYIKIKDNYSRFKSQSDLYIQSKLDEYATLQNEDSFLNLISWYTSSISDKKKKAKTAIAYRDKIYTYTEKYLEEINTEYNDKKDLSSLYDSYISEFPEP